mgnify:CR=1 FL=1
MGKFVLRFDDITPDMDWDKFLKVKIIAEKYGVRSILGVVPDNKDLKLSVRKKISNTEFFNNIYKYGEYGDTVAQHGTYHTYTIKGRSILNISDWSEFAGYSYEQQLQKLKIGKEILQEHGVWQPYFMAPSHSFDLNTLKALKALSFKAITDGYGFYPYQVEGITLVPQLVGKPIPFIPFGVQTICLHTNSMNNNDLNYIVDFIINNHYKFIDFKEAVNIKSKSNTLQLFTYTASKGFLKNIRKLRKII